MKNTLTPKKLASEIVADHKSSADSVISVCRKFADGWSQYSTGAWGNKDLEEFLFTIHEGGFGPDPKDTILKKADHNDRYTIGSSAGMFSNLKKVGEHQIWEDKDVNKLCRVNSLTTLYNLTVYYDTALKKYGDVKRAMSALLELLAIGSELTVADVRDGINSLKVKKGSFKPKSGTDTSWNEEGVTNVYDLALGDKIFENILLTPSAAQQKEIVDSSFESVLENHLFHTVAHGKAELTVAVRGENIAAAVKLGELVGRENLNLYCLPSKKTSAILNLSSETIIATTKSDVGVRIAGDNLEQKLRNIAFVEGKSNLHVYSEAEDDDWVVAKS